MDAHHLADSPAWQVLEERISDAPVTQYVWNPVYIDAMILRDRSVSGELDERLWVTHDANFYVTMLMDVYSDVVERLTYTPFGVATVHEGDYAVKGSSDFVWQYPSRAKLMIVICGRYSFPKVTRVYHREKVWN